MGHVVALENSGYPLQNMAKSQLQMGFTTGGRKDLAISCICSSKIWPLPSIFQLFVPWKSLLSEFSTWNSWNIAMNIAGLKVVRLPTASSALVFSFWANHMTWNDVLWEESSLPKMPNFNSSSFQFSVQVLFEFAKHLCQALLFPVSHWDLGNLAPRSLVKAVQPPLV